MTSKSDKIILFDVAGTLVDFHPEWRAERLAKHSKLSEERISRLFSGDESPGVLFDAGQIVATEFYNRCCETLGVEPTQKFAGVFRHAYAEIFSVRPKMGELIEKLADEYELWMMSNTNVWHLEYLRQNFSYLNLFTRNCNSHDVGYVKPDPRVFQKAIEWSGKNPEDLIFVDDKESNISAATAEGISGVHFTTPEKLIDDLKALGVEIPDKALSST